MSFAHDGHERSAFPFPGAGLDHARHDRPGAAAFDDAREALEWAADHGAELGGDPRRLILAGSRRAAGLVAALARHARDRGWPPIDAPSQ